MKRVCNSDPRLDSRLVGASFNTNLHYQGYQAGTVQYTVYDERGNVVRSRSASGVQSATLFDAGGRVRQQRDGLGNTSTSQYRTGDYQFGLLDSVIAVAALGNGQPSGQTWTTHYEYNGFGQLSREQHNAYDDVAVSTLILN